MVKYSVLIIKPLSIGRGDGPFILQDVLDRAPVRLRKFRAWNICSNTWSAISDVSLGTESEFPYHHSKIQLGSKKQSWVCLFDSDHNTTDILSEVIGPLERKVWTRQHLRLKYCSFVETDDVFYIAPKSKESLVASLLFDRFVLEDFDHES